MSATITAPTSQAKVEMPSLNSDDIEQSAIRSIVHGDIPTADQVASALMEARQSLHDKEDDMHLSKKGKQLENDLDEVLGSAVKLIDEKNVGGVIDDLVKNAREVSREVNTETKKLNATVGAIAFPTFFNSTLKYRMVKDGAQALNYSKDIVLFILGSGEFKQYLIDFLDFLQSFISYTGDELINIGQSVKKDVKDQSVDSTLSELKDIKDSALSKGKEWNSEVRKEYVQRFRTLMKRASERPEFNEMINVFWTWMDQMKERAEFMKDRLVSKGEEVKGKATRSAESIAKSEAFERMWEDAKIIVDDFAGEGAFDEFYNTTWDLYSDLLDDIEAHAFFSDLKKFVSKAIKDSEFMDLEEAQTQSEHLMDRAWKIFTSKKYSEDFSKFFQSGRDLAWKVANDSTTQEFADKVKKFAQHFALDAEGNIDINVIQKSLVQMKNMVFPLLKEKLGTINIKQVLGTDGDTEYALQDVGLCIPELLPESLELKTKTDTKVNISKLETEKQYAKIIMELNQVKPVFKNVSFWYKKNSFPKLEDNGVANVDLSGGKGTRFQVVWKIETNSADSNRPFAISLIRVKCVIDKIDITILEAKHNILDKIAVGLFSNSIKSKIAHGLVEGIVGILKPMNDTLNNWFATNPIDDAYDKVNAKISQTYGRYMDKLAQNPHPLRTYEEAAKDRINDVTSRAEALKETLSVKAQDLRDIISEDVALAKEIKSDIQGLYSKATAKEPEYTFEESDEKAAERKKYEKESQEKTEELKQKAVELKDTTIETAGKLKDKTVEGATELKEFAQEKTQEAVEYAQEKYPEVRDKAIEMKDKAVEKATELKDQAVEKGTELKEKAEEKYEQAKDYANKKIPEVKEKANELKDQAIEKGTELKKKAEEKVDEAKDYGNKKIPEVKEKANELKDQAVEKGTELKKKAEEKVEEGKEKASELKDQASKKLDEGKAKANELKDQAKEKGTELKKKAEEKVEEGKEKASELSDKASKKVEEGKKKAKDAKDDVVQKATELKDEVSEKYPETKKKLAEIIEDLQDTTSASSEKKESTTAKSDQSALYFGKVAAPPAFDQSEEDKMGAKSYAEIAKDLSDVPAEPLAPGKVSWDSEWSEGTTAI